MPDQALSGLKVLEFANLVSGPYCGKMFADLGAEVIKIEDPVRGDKARSREPFAGNAPGLERSGLFAYLNTNKLSVTLDPQADFAVQLYPPAVVLEGDAGHGPGHPGKSALAGHQLVHPSNRQSRLRPDSPASGARLLLGGLEAVQMSEIWCNRHVKAPAIGQQLRYQAVSVPVIKVGKAPAVPIAGLLAVCYPRDLASTQ